MKRFVLISTLLFAVFGLVTFVNAQEPAPATNTYGPQYQLELKELTNNPVFKDLEITKKFARRLPNFYGEVVNEKQKADIYEIQASYFQVIESLKLRLQKLEEERNAQIEAILTADQKAHIESKAKAASEKRAAKRAN